MSRNALLRLLILDQETWKGGDGRLRCMIASEDIALAIALSRR